jgi:hypothetical protein
LQAAIALDAGDAEEGRRLVEEGRTTAERTGEHWYDAGLARMARMAEVAGSRQ